MALLYQDLTDEIISCFYIVYNELHYGFREKVYQNALTIELIKHGFFVEIEKPIDVFYNGQIVGNYYADIIVNQVIILELKAATAICDEHLAQLDSYLHATDLEVGLILNFGSKPEFKRRMFTNDRKYRI